jgi:hypothetical protein
MEGIDIAYIVVCVACFSVILYCTWNSSPAETKEQKKPKAPQQTLTPAEREMQEQTKMMRKMYDLMWWEFMFGKKKR